MFRKIVRLSSTLKSSPTFTNRHCACHLNYVNKIQDERNPNIFKNANQIEDKLMIDLSTRSPTKILITLMNNKNILESAHVTHVFKNLSLIYREMYNNDKIDLKKEINTWVNEDTCKQILLILNSNLRKLSSPEAIEVLNACVKMNLPYSSCTIQILIKTVSECRDVLSFRDIRLLSYILQKLPVTQVTINLQRCLEEKFNSKVLQDFNENNFQELRDGFFFICKNLPDSHYLHLFITKLQNYIDTISLKDSIIIFESLCAMNIYYPKGWKELVHQVQNNIIKDIDNLDYIKINFILFILANRCKSRRTLEEFYNPIFIDELIKKLILSDVGFENSLSAIKSLNYLKHGSKELLNYACASYYERNYVTDKEISNEHSKLLVLLTGFAITKYKTVIWNDIQNSLLQNKNILNYDLCTLCIVALNLITLGCYYTPILNNIFHSCQDYSNNKRLHWTFLKIYQKLKTNEHYSGPMPTENLLNSMNKYFEHFIRRKQKQKNFLLNILEEGMGGPMYVKCNVGTRYFHIIDFVVAFKEDGTPIPLNSLTVASNKLSNVEYIENFKDLIPSNSKMLLILLCPSFYYVRNWNKVAGEYAIIKETLELMSYSVLEINEEVFNRIPVEQQASKLMNQIRSKFL